MSLDSVVVKGNPFGPQWEGLPEERINRNSAQEANGKSANSGWNDDLHNGESLGDQEVKGNGSHQDGQLGAKHDSSGGEQIETEAVASVDVSSAVGYIVCIQQST